MTTPSWAESPIHDKIREAGLDNCERTDGAGSDATDYSPYSCVEFLRRYNRWRRGDETLAMEDPKAIGNALDAICDLVETLQRERNAMASRIHRASVAFCKDGSDGGIAAEMFQILSEHPRSHAEGRVNRLLNHSHQQQTTQHHG